MVDNPAIQRNAAKIGEKLRAEDGIGKAVQFVEQVAGVG
jgi:hypothetical protein